MVIYRIHLVNIIDVVRSLIKCIWSIYRRYVPNIFEILLYYMVNNRVVWSYIRYIWSLYRCNMVIN